METEFIDTLYEPKQIEKKNANIRVYYNIIRK